LEGFRKGASLFVGALLGWLLSGGPEGNGKKGSGGWTSPHGGGGVHSLGTLRDNYKGALETEHLSLYGSSVRGTWRGAPLLGVLKVMKGRLCGWASLFIGAQLDNLEWAHLLGTLSN